MSRPDLIGTPLHPPPIGTSSGAENREYAMFIVNDSGPIPQISSEIERLQHLLSDLRRARAGQHPDRQTIASAPVLDHWQLTFRPEPCLIGTMRGHPHVRDRHRGMTSGLWLLAPELGYARTLSRVYALGRPAQSQTPLP
jgi:hypothetical protein